MKTRTLFGTLITLILLISPAYTQENAADLLFSAPELDFFCKYMLDREFVMQPQAGDFRQLDKGKVESDFDRKTRYANLTVTPGGFTFNALLTIKQTNYDLDADGKRILPGRVIDRTEVIKYLFGRSESSGKLVGHLEVLYSDSPNAKFGMTRNMLLFMEGEKLVMVSIPGGYHDFYAAGGKRKSATAKSRTEITVKDGKITRTAISEVFDVDTETLEMTPTGERSTLIDYSELAPVISP